MPNAQLTGKKLLAKISERSEQKANCFLSLFNFLLGVLANYPNRAMTIDKDVTTKIIKLGFSHSLLICKNKVPKKKVIESDNKEESTEVSPP